MQTNAIKPTRQNPLTFYLRTLLYMFIALLLRAVTFAPLAFLFVFPAGSPWQFLALLCPVLLIFFLLPLRFSFADALVQRPRERNFSFDTALSSASYGQKLLQSILHLLSVAKWAIPLAAMLGYAYWCYRTVGVFELMSTLTAWGKTATSIFYSVIDFFRGLFGYISNVAVEGGLVEGLYVLVAILALGVLILLWGAVRNSAYRYIWALSKHEGTHPRQEARRRLRGRRWKQLLSALINLVLWVPFLFVVCITIKDVVSDASALLMDALASKQLDLSQLSAALFPLIFAFLVLYMPLLPARRIITAFFATRKIRREAPEIVDVAANAEPSEAAASATTPTSAYPTPATIFTTSANDSTSSSTPSAPAYPTPAASSGDTSTAAEDVSQHVPVADDSIAPSSEPASTQEDSGEAVPAPFTPVAAYTPGGSYDTAPVSQPASSIPSGSESADATEPTFESIASPEAQPAPVDTPMQAYQPAIPDEPETQPEPENEPPVPSAEPSTSADSSFYTSYFSTHEDASPSSTEEAEPMPAPQPAEEEHTEAEDAPSSNHTGAEDQPSAAEEAASSEDNMVESPAQEEAPASTADSDVYPSRNDDPEPPAFTIGQ